jgi:hypothetical protein
MVSLYHAHYSTAGEGTVAFVDIPGASGFTGVCTDNREFAQFIIETMIRGRGNVFDRDLPLVAATMTRSGDIREAPSWTIEAGANRIVVTWADIHPPLVGPPTIHPYIVFTALFFADAGSISLNGEKLAGRPYLREGWRQNLGEPHSSCVFALAETMIQAPQ